MDSHTPTRYGLIDIDVAHAVLRSLNHHSQPAVTALDRIHDRFSADDERPSARWNRLLDELFPTMPHRLHVVGDGDRTAASAADLGIAGKLYVAAASWLLARHTEAERYSDEPIDGLDRAVRELLDLADR
jgi:hypothetical protein